MTKKLNILRIPPLYNLNLKNIFLGPKPPMFDDSTAVTHSVKRNQEVKLVCNETVGLPRPEVQWFLVPSVGHIQPKILFQ